MDIRTPLRFLNVKLENTSLLPPTFPPPSLPPSVKWFSLTTQISFIKFQLTIKGGPHYMWTVIIYEPGKWNTSLRFFFFYK